MKEIDENDRELAFTAYLKILDRTRGNKDVGSGERCGYIPKALEQMYLSLLEKGEVSGKFICKEANPNIYAAVSGMLQEQLDNDEKITVVIPGGFKPPHKGHVEMINHFANLPNVEEVIVFMGSKPRMSADKSVVVSKDKSIELFKLFDLAPNIRFGDVTQRPKKDGSTYENPFSDAVDVLFDERFAGKKVAIGHPTKDPAYGDAFAARAKSMKKDMAADLVAVTPADTTGGLSATDLRNAVQDGDIERLKNFIPSNIVEDYLKILIGD
jgi:cytidyltransferase-like protein